MITPSESTLGPGSSKSGNFKLAERKLKRLRSAGLFGEDTKGATIRRACTGNELCNAYRLVHDVFIDTGFLRPEPSGLRLRIFETTSETATFIAEKDGGVVGVISVVGDSADLGLPSDAAFKPELDQLRAKGLRLCEFTNQAVTEAYRQSAVPTELMRCAVAHALRAGYQESVATVSPSHHAFYGLMGFGDLGSERSYSAKLHDPVIALRLDLNGLLGPDTGLGGAAEFIRRFATETNPFIDLVDNWGKTARRHFLNADLLEQLFVRPGNFLAERSAAELRSLRHRWGRELFDVLTAGTEFEPFHENADDATPTPVELRSPGAAPFPPADTGSWLPAPSASAWTALRNRIISVMSPGDDWSGQAIDRQQLWSYPSM
ncbi:MAG: hypothetical protein H7343_05055 [Undibacterium sp.]|nr:hypothetical protein [Opitutaceae bacterium]